MMRSSCPLVALMVVLAALAMVVLSTPPSPQPPTSWPTNWFTWVVTSVTKDGAPKPLWVRGQKVVYNVDKQFSCRFEQQNLTNTSADRPMDFCDYAAGARYHLDLLKPTNLTCGSTTPLKEKTLVPLTWPDEYLQRAVFLGIDKVGQLNCNHFFAPKINVGGRFVMFDVWTSIEKGYPCQIGLFEVDSPIHWTWAFDGFQSPIPDPAMVCTQARTSCAQKDFVCVAKRSASTQQLEGALSWVCGNAIDCSPISEGGSNFEPNTLLDHCDWAFNTYYQKNKNQGEAACNFGGSAELVPPKNTTRSLRPRPKPLKRTWLDLVWPLYSNDLACSVGDGPK